MVELKLKHPPLAEVKEDSLLHGLINKVPNCCFNDIVEIIVGRAASLTKASGGPSHVHSDHFCHILLSKKFKAEAKNLREQIALLARLLASTFADPHSIDFLTTCRLIILYKNPTVRPIGIVEVLRRVIGKTINLVLKDRQYARGCQITSDRD